MSDTEARKTGYRIEYASSGRAKCKGPKPCAGTTLAKGELRFGSLVDFQGKTSYSWRHWGCVTSKIIANAKKQLEEVEELDGFEELKAEDQDKVKKAWDSGEVAVEDVPDTARKADGGDKDAEEKTKKKRAAPKKKAAEADEDGEEKLKKRPAKKAKETADDDELEAEEKPKKTRVRKPKKAVEDDEDEQEEEKPKKARKKAEPKEPKAKAPPKKRAPKKKADDESGEDFGDEIDKIIDEDEAEDAGQKRKRPVSKSTKPTSRASKRSKASSSKSKEVVEDEDED